MGGESELAHAINGFIGREDDLRAAARTLPEGWICPLHGGLAFLPVRQVGPSREQPAKRYEQFAYLTEPMADWACEQSRRFPILYLETEYFGGLGTQSAIVWQEGAVVFGPAQTDERTLPVDRAINSGVRQLGVARGKSADEFSALGLDRYRQNEDWIAAIGQPATEPARSAGESTAGLAGGDSVSAETLGRLEYGTPASMDEVAAEVRVVRRVRRFFGFIAAGSLVFAGFSAGDRNPLQWPSMAAATGCLVFYLAIAFVTWIVQRTSPLRHGRRRRGRGGI